MTAERQKTAFDYATNDEEMLRMIGDALIVGGDDWGKSHPQRMAWLAEHGYSREKAIAACEEFTRERLKLLEKRGAKVEYYAPAPGAKKEKLLLELANTEAGEKPEPFSIYRGDYRVVTGPVASVCPNAKPRIDDDLSERIAVALREAGQIPAGKTIHWIGSERAIETVCACDLDNVGSKPAAESANGKDGESDPLDKIWQDIRKGRQRDLLRLLMKNEGKDISHAKAINEVWKDHGCTDEALKKTVDRINEKIGRVASIKRTPDSLILYRHKKDR